MCILSLWWDGGVILCLYVDDILIFGMNIDAINEVKSFLLKSFDMKDLGEVYVILNIKLIKGENGITRSLIMWRSLFRSLWLRNQCQLSL